MITNTKFWKENKEDIIRGLIFGLIFGLIGGLICGLTTSIFIILCHFSEALPFVNGVFPILFLIIGILLLTELLFHLDKTNVKIKVRNEKDKKK